MGANPIYATKVAMTPEWRPHRPTRFRLANGSPYIFPIPPPIASRVATVHISARGNFFHDTDVEYESGAVAGRPNRINSCMTGNNHVGLLEPGKLTH